GEKGPDRRSVDTWVEKLEATRLIHRVEPFGHSAAAHVAGRRRSKLYAADHGLIVAFSRSPDPMADADVRGRVVEAAVLSAIRTTGASASYFDDGHGEKDFVVDLAGVRSLVEVTAGTNVSDKQAGMPALAKRVHAS